MVERWRDLIQRIWHVAPLCCPSAKTPLRVIAVIDDPLAAEKILRHLGAWHDPPAGLPCRAVHRLMPTNLVGMGSRCPITKTC